MTTEQATARGPAPLGGNDRIPGPDLARGFMLLLIVLANTAYYLYGGQRSASGAHPVDGSALDTVVQGVLITTVDLRVYPMFAFLFGYGLVMIARRQSQRGLSEKQVRSVIQRRNVWLIVFGAVHALLLWGGDILGAYGLTGLVLVWLFLRRSDRTLLVWAGIGSVIVALVAGLSALGAVAVLSGEDTGGGFDPGFADSAYASISEENFWAAAVARITMWPVQVTFVQGLFGLVVPVSILLGFWAARHRVLERPQEHRQLLWVTAIAGITLGWSFGLVHALAHAGVISGVEPAMAAMAAPQMATGLACGLGYVAVFGLIGGRLAGRRLGPVAYAVTAVGKRSMSCYLAQSVLCAPLLAAWGLGLGAALGSAGMAAFAVGVWIITIGYAVLLERQANPGPAETLLRRLVYGRARHSHNPPAYAAGSN
ncbi:DUF418 domain-containing protein [Nocardia speluncae]|uniref:DUF418 domain-containing protein n=1 Tax=Nocardia speluncae TaxID=419477 RepID=A0A846X994_9NOCA|nr:DUF418 domain-containing protein [Nocardia speluncae]NKY32532.1 DUF418 domain-containing protein [Nocardia speluncae]